MLSRLLAYLGAVLSWLLGREKLYRAKHVEDAPDVLKSGWVYVVGADGHDWSAVMACPCGCGKPLEINLLKSAKPVWRLTEHANRSVSIEPSIWLKSGCKCHFFITRGRIRWV